MALGAITPQPTSPLGTTVPNVFGDCKVSVTNIVGDGAYASGGTALTPQQLGLPNKVVFADAQIIASSGSNNVASSAVYNISTGKLQMFTTGTTGAYAEATGNLSGLTVQIQAYGF